MAEYRVRGLTIKAIMPIHQLGGFQRLRNWESHEPACLDWIDSFNPGTTFLDIGCAEGTESLYAAARHKDLKIHAVDVGLLGGFNMSANIAVNGFHNIDFYAIGIAGTTGLIEVDEGRGYYKVPGFPELRQTSKHMFSMTIDDFCAYTSTAPNYIKIDVDGLEEKIVQGMRKTLGNTSLQSIYIEINDEESYKNINEIFNQHGFSEVLAAEENHVFSRKPE